MLLKVTRAAAFGLCIAGLAQHSMLQAADPAPAGRVLQYRSQTGETSFAIVLEPKLSSRATQRDHIVLFDTSASQTGEHRNQALAVLDSFLKSLPASDRIRLFGVDVGAKELTTGFAASQSVEMANARNLLARRAPLGATDFGKAIEVGLSATESGRSSTIHYIGDGVSGLNVLDEPKLQGLVSRLRTQQVPFSCFAVGPRKDLPLLGLLANWSGGVVLLDDGEVRADLVGEQLAKAAVANVFYPSKLTTDAAQTKLFPSQPLPLRSDRETILLGKGPAPKSVLIGDANQTLSWQVSANDSKDDQAFLSTLVQRAEQQPLNVPFASLKLLEIARSDFAARINQLSNLGDTALFDHDLKRAEVIGKAIREMDPTNETGGRLLTSAAKFKMKLVSQVGEPPLETEGATRRDSGSLIAEQEIMQQIKTDQMQLSVNSAIEEARGLIADDADSAINKIKKAQGAVNSAQDIDPDVRLNLAKRLQGVLADIKAQSEVLEQKRISAQERVAVADAQRRLISQMQLEDERMEQLIDRVRSLLEEAVRGNPSSYGEAESVAEAAVNLRPGTGTATAAKTGAVAARQLYVAFYLRNLRADRFLETLEQVERSHVPFPDEPPVRWPRPEVWKALSERRKQYASVDLHKSSAAEKRIVQALDQETSINFADSQLDEAITFLSQRHEIPILLDPAVEAAGVPPDSKIMLPPLAGIPLRSALNIVLKPLNLTYVIQDNVMYITTIEDAQNRLQTRVYPMGDLVLGLTAVGRGQNGGGGAFGGGQQIGGGQQGGGGGGGQQGGQQGGGGGFFNVPAAALPQAVQRKAPINALPQVKAPKAVAPAPIKNKDAGDPEMRQILNGILREDAALMSVKPFAGMAQVQDTEAARILKKKP